MAALFDDCGVSEQGTNPRLEKLLQMEGGMHTWKGFSSAKGKGMAKFG